MSREAMQMALEALESDPISHAGLVSRKQAITALRERLAQPEQEPIATVESVATVVSESGNQEITMSWWHEPALPVGTKLYTAPPKRKPLPPQSPCEMTQAEGKMFKLGWLECEAAHGIKGDA